MRIQTESDFDDLTKAAKLLAVTAAWSQLGLWDRLAASEDPVDLAELPGDLRALSITAPVLAHAGLLQGNRQRWQLSPSARALHERGELPTRRNLGWLSDLGELATILERGGPLHPEKTTTGGVRVEDPAETRRFLSMLWRRSATSARNTATWLAPRLPEGARVLDVGGGHGRYAMELVARGCRLTLFDLPPVIDLARERHGDALAYQAGDLHTEDFARHGPYDAALLSNVVHGESPEACADLCRRLALSLRPGGLLLLKDMFIDEQGRDPLNAVFFGLTMLFYTEGGQSYTLGDVAGWCRGAGLEPPQAYSMEGHSLVFARRGG